MTCHATARRASSSPRAMIVGWAVIAAAGVVGLASLPPTGAADQTAIAPPTVLTAATATASPAVFAAGRVAGSPSAGETASGTTTPAVAQLASAAATAEPAGAGQAARIAVALRLALAQVGLPYVWGGNGPSNGDAGFDCSGLTHFAYAAAGIALPRTAHTQFYAGPHVPAGAPLQPGDLVFYGTPTFVHHVGMYLGAGRMVNAPTFGEPVQVAYYRWPGDDYIGATRPDGSTSAAGLFMLPFIPEAIGPPPVRPSTRTSDVFAAPRAPLVAAVPVPGAIAAPEAQTAAAALNEERQVGALASAAPALAAPAVTGPTTVSLAATPGPTAAAPSSPAPGSPPSPVAAPATSVITSTATTSTATAPSSTTSTEAAAPTPKAAAAPPPAPASKAAADPPAPATVATKKKPAPTKKPPVVTTSPPSAASSSAAAPETQADGASSTPTTTTPPDPTPTP